MLRVGEKANSACEITNNQSFGGGCGQNGGRPDQAEKQVRFA